MSPKFAVAESPDLARTLKLAGFGLLTDKTDARGVAEAIRNSSLGQKELLVITPASTPILLAWVQSLVASGRLVAVLGDNAPIAKTAQVQLPCSVNDILGVFHAPSKFPYGEWIVNADLTVSESGTEDSTPESAFESLVWNDDDNDVPTPVPAPQRYVDDDFDEEPVTPGRRVEAPYPTSQPTPPPARPATPAVPFPVVPSVPAPVAQPVAPGPVTPAVPAPAVPALVQPSVPYSAPRPAPEPETYRPAPQPATPEQYRPAPPPEQYRPAPPPAATPGSPYSPAPPEQYRAAVPEPGPWRPAVQPGPQPPTSPGFPPLVGERPAQPEQLYSPQPVPVHGPAPVILVAAAKGGVGKTAFTLMLAERAATAGMNRVILVDGNRGQGDIGKYLRVSKPLPTIYDAAVADNPRGAIIPPKMLNGARDPRLPQLGFGMVMAPRPGQVDSAVVTSGMYGDVVEEAREFADLVIIDTQITEEEDTSGLWDEVWLPLLRSGGWCVGLASDSTPAVQNLRDRLAQWAQDGVGADRLLLALNDVSAETMLDIDQVVALLARQADVVGVLPRLDEVKQAFQVGRIPADVPAVAQISDAILLRATGNPAFAPPPPAEDRGGFLAGLFGRGRR